MALKSHQGDAARAAQGPQPGLLLPPAVAHTKAVPSTSVQPPPSAGLRYDPPGPPGLGHPLGLPSRTEPRAARAPERGADTTASASKNHLSTIRGGAPSLRSDPQRGAASAGLPGRAANARSERRAVLGRWEPAARHFQSSRQQPNFPLPAPTLFQFKSGIRLHLQLQSNSWCVSPCGLQETSL